LYAFVEGESNHIKQIKDKPTPILHRPKAKGRQFHLSVTLVIHAVTVQDTETDFAPHDRAMFLVLWGQILRWGV